MTNKIRFEAIDHAGTQVGNGWLAPSGECWKFCLVAGHQRPPLTNCCTFNNVWQDKISTLIFLIFFKTAASSNHTELALNNNHSLKSHWQYNYVNLQLNVTLVIIHCFNITIVYRCALPVTLDFDNRLDERYWYKEMNAYGQLWVWKWWQLKTTLDERLCFKELNNFG